MINREDSIIVVNNATVRFNMASEKVDNLKEYFIKLTKRQLYFQEFFALKDISIDIKKGESWGIIGRNGAGKSTLLKLICGILSPYQGSVSVYGNIAPLIELGAGMDPQLTAEENIFLNGALLGYSKKYMGEHFQEIVDFADLGDFLDMPIKNYSSGMRARLGFAVATAVKPEILVVDEVLSVGDAAFRKKCEKRMSDMLSAGTTLLFVSHSEREVERLCQKAIWLDRGEVVMSGPSKEVCMSYSNKFSSSKQTYIEPKKIESDMPNITVVGTGYVGIVTAAVFASKGYKVICFDTDKSKIESLKKGECPLFEPGLNDLLRHHSDKLFFTTDMRNAYQKTDVIIIAVGTPETPSGAVDLSSVYQVIEDISRNAADKCMVVVKSTVPVGTTSEIKRFFRQNSRTDIRVLSNPEFLSQGTAVHDMMEASRIIIGADTEEEADDLANLYTPFNRPIVKVKCASAEMIKYASNDFLALKISYINEIANLCEKTGADINEVVKGMEKDPRIGSGFLRAGIGYGGSCLPKDTKALRWLASERGYNFHTLDAAISVNEKQQCKLIDKASEFYPCFKGITVAFLGVTFKPNTDDIRNAPAVTNAEILLMKGAKIQAWDPKGLPNLKKIFSNRIEYCGTIREALHQADICLIFTDWAEVKNMELSCFKKEMRNPIVLDGRNCFIDKDLKKYQIVYEPIGMGYRKDTK